MQGNEEENDSPPHIEIDPDLEDEDELVDDGECDAEEDEIFEQYMFGDEIE